MERLQKEWRILKAKIAKQKEDNKLRHLNTKLDEIEHQLSYAISLEEENKKRLLEIQQKDNQKPTHKKRLLEIQQKDNQKPTHKKRLLEIQQKDNQKPTHKKHLK
jgi:hypothetical protein